MAIIPKVGSGGDKFDIINSKKVFRISSDGTTVEKHSFVQESYTTPSKNHLKDFKSATNHKPKIIWEGTNEKIYSFWNGGSYSLILARITNGNITISEPCSSGSDPVMHIEQLSTNSWIIVEGYDKSMIRVITYNGTKLVAGTALSSYKIKAGSYFKLISSNKFMHIYPNVTSGSSEIKVALFAISGSTITEKTDTAIHTSSLGGTTSPSSYAPKIESVFEMGNGVAVVAKSYRKSSYKPESFIGTVYFSINNYSITSGAMLELSRDSYDSVSSSKGMAFDSTHFFVDMNDYRKFCTISGTTISSESKSYHETVHTSFFYKLDKSRIIELESSSSSVIRLLKLNNGKLDQIDSSAFRYNSGAHCIIKLSDSKIRFVINDVVVDATVSTSAVSLKFINLPSDIGAVGYVGLVKDTTMIGAYGNKVFLLKPDGTFIKFSNTIPIDAENKYFLEVYNDVAWIVPIDADGASFKALAISITQNNKIYFEGEYGKAEASSYGYGNVMSIWVYENILKILIDDYNSETTHKAFYYEISMAQDGTILVPGPCVIPSIDSIHGVTLEKISSNKLGGVLILAKGGV